MDKFYDPKTGKELFRVTDTNKEVVTKEGEKHFKDKKKKKDEDGTSNSNRSQHSEEG
jgi:hypothetical protein